MAIAANKEHSQDMRLDYQQNVPKTAKQLLTSNYLHAIQAVFSLGRLPSKLHWQLSTEHANEMCHKNIDTVLR